MNITDKKWFTSDIAAYKYDAQVFSPSETKKIDSQKTSAKALHSNGFGNPFIFSLRLKVTLSFSILLLLIVGLLFLAFMRYEWTFLFHEGQKRAQSMANSLVVNARDPLLVQDDLRLGPVIESVIQDDEVLYAYIIDHLGRVRYHSNSERTGMVLAYGVPKPEGGIIQASSPIEVENTKVGMTVLGLGVDHIKQAMMATAKGLLFPLGLGAAMGIIGIFLLAGIHVKRIKRLADAVQALGFGDLRVRVEDTGNDEVGRLSNHFNKMVGQLYSARQQIESNFKETICALAATVEAKDAYTHGHCDRVGMISLAIGKKLEIGEKQLTELELAAILHDIGKIGVKTDTLGKMGPLNDKEFKDIQQHPVTGAKILKPISSLREVGLYVKHHHEHYDGSGYPDGLKGDGIPQASRIIHLVDAFDAMTTNRPYRKALSRREAFTRIRKGSGKQFDPVLVDLLFQVEQEGQIDAICREVAESNA